MEGRSESKDLRSLAESLRCADGNAASPLRPLLGDADLVWSLELTDRHYLVGRAHLDSADALTFSAELPELSRDEPLALLLPSADAPGPTLLARDDALVQGRFKADAGLDPARLVPDEEQVEGLFQLKSRIFADLVLEGSWELAVYEPTPGDLIPRIALAVEYTRRTAAETAWNAYLREVENAWGFVPVPVTVGPWEGACVTEVRVLPELAPCYVLTERALVLGWNREALEKALGGKPSDELADRSRLVVELDRLPRADVRLTESLLERLGAVREGEKPPAPLTYPWRRLVVSGRRDGGRYLLEGRLLAGKAP